MRGLTLGEWIDHYWLRFLQYVVCPIAAHKWKRTRLGDVQCERCLKWSEGV